MSPERLLKEFERISEAPDAVSRLRHFILDLAVRGKLVEQHPDDKSFSDSSLGGETTEDTPFEVPASWIWSQLVNAAHVEMGQSPPSDSYNNSKDGMPFFQGKADFGKRHPTPRYWCTKPSKTAVEGDILISVRAPVGPTNVANEECCIGRGLAALRPGESVDREYLLYALRSFESALEALGFGTTFVAINKKQLTTFPIPLPPPAEQHRIVAKVDELMALCDELETAQVKREARRDRLVAATLHGLNNGDTAESNGRPGFTQSARFYLNHLPRLTTRPGHIHQLRQTILNLAVRGKLVPQDPKDEPARNDIAEIVRKDRKKGGHPERINGESHEVYAEARSQMSLPSAWGVASLAESALVVVDCPHSTPKWTDMGKICVRTNQFRPGFLDLAESRFVSNSTFNKRIERLRPVENDILYSREGGILGVACLVPPGVELCLGQRMMLIRVASVHSPRFFELTLNSPLITEIALKRTTGGAAPRVNVSTVKAYPIPIPPLAEQHRIVGKVDALMALCDELEAQLRPPPPPAANSLKPLSTRRSQGADHEFSSTKRNCCVMIPLFVDVQSTWDVLPPGVHDATMEDIEQRFAIDAHRQELFRGFKAGVESLRRAGCKEVFLDGSYVTSKPTPGDFDACWDPVGVDVNKLDPVLLDFSHGRRAQKVKFRGEFFPSCARADGVREFVDFFQVDKDTGEQKGIIRVQLF